ncbi:MAG: imidazole glycerol phosphate synthase subunit HisH [Clostridia bacterium]|nr:imidazole glycerol phosphate synthase subunit HisH [Clostridia bacterium]
MAIAIVDYGVGNLFSLAASFRAIGADTVVTGDPAVLHAADRIILPGVGAFEDAAAKLRATGLDRTVCAEAAAGKPLLGICLGMQMLFERSFEYGEHTGLGLIPGEVRPIAPIIGDRLKVPHIGWNSLDFPADKQKSPLLRYINEGDYVYFVHSFAAMRCDDAVIATSTYGVPLTAAVACSNVFGTQFHPEKSGDVGLRILRAFCEL